MTDIDLFYGFWAGCVIFAAIILWLAMNDGRGKWGD